MWLFSLVHFLLSSDSSLFQVGARSAIKGIKENGPPGLLDVMEMQAQVANIPHIGISENVCYPAWQLNIASAVSERPKTSAFLHSVLVMQVMYEYILC